MGCVVDVTIAAWCDRFRCRVPCDGCLFRSLTVMCCICELMGQCVNIMCVVVFSGRNPTAWYLQVGGSWSE